MPYRFATTKVNYSDYSSGHVFYSAPGHPAFPIRLISEIFQRCNQIRKDNGDTKPAIIYDPCCGAAYHLATLAYLHWDEIDTIIGSDINSEILNVANRNLGLLTIEGLNNRKHEIEKLLADFGKASHKEALDSVKRLSLRLDKVVKNRKIKTHLFHADALDQSELSRKYSDHTLDVMIADVPYDQIASWVIPSELTGSEKSPIWHLLQAVHPLLAKNSVVAIAANKTQKIHHEKYEKVERFQIGKRNVVLLSPF